MKIDKFKMLVDGIYEFHFNDSTIVIGAPLNFAESTYIVFKETLEEFNENIGKRSILELEEEKMVLKVNPEEIIFHALLST